MHHQLRAAPDGPVRDRVEVADDDVGLHAELEQRVRSAVDTDQDGPYLLDVGPQDAEVLPVVEAPHDDEHVATAQVDRELGQVRRVSEQVPLASHASSPVQGFPSEQMVPAAATTCWQPAAPQLSAVHGLPSSQVASLGHEPQLWVQIQPTLVQLQLVPLPQSAAVNPFWVVAL